MPVTPRAAVSRIAARRMPVILALVCLAAWWLTPEHRFASPDNLINVLRQVSLEATIAFGMTAIIITAGIDLSVGSQVALTGVAGASVMRSCIGAGWPGWAAIGTGGSAAVGVGAAVGAASGAVIAWVGLPPFIVTLAAMLMARGGAFILCDGQPVYELPESLIWLGRGFIMEGWIGRTLPVPVLIMAGAYAFFAFTLTRTVWGREVVSVGSNEEASRLAGINVPRTKLLVYTVTGGVCGLVGLLHDAKLMAGDPKVGDMWELNVIAAVVVGGTSLFGGRGSMTGTLIGALIIGVLNNTLNLMHVEHFWQKVTLGAVILAAAATDAALRKLEGART